MVDPNKKYKNSSNKKGICPLFKREREVEGKTRKGKEEEEM